MFREQLAHLIHKDPEMEVCGESDNIREALSGITRLQPDIAIVDITLKGSSGLELIKDLKAQGSGVPVLVLSMHDETAYAERALRAGAKGYITKHEVSSEVMCAIRRVLSGGVYLSPQMTNLMLRKLAGGKASAAGEDGVTLLTDRELEVFQLIGQGVRPREIAEKLNLGLATIDTYRARIKEKLDLSSGLQLQTRAVEWVQQQQHGL